MTELRVFSPSATSTYSTCPRKWFAQRQGWKSRVVQYPELCAILGEGFSTAMEHWNNALKQGRTPNTGECLDFGNKVMMNRVMSDVSHGRRIHEKDQAFTDNLPTLLHKAVSMYETVQPLAGWVPTHVEQPFPEWGNARPDLIATNAGATAIFDYKIKVKLESRWEEKELSKFDRSPQRYFYHLMTKIPTFYIVMVVLSPKAYIKVEAYTENGRYRDTFHNDCAAKWVHMDVLMLHMTDYVSPMGVQGSLIHHDEYGACEFEEACLTHQFDPQLMTLNYVKIPRETK